MTNPRTPKARASKPATRKAPSPAPPVPPADDLTTVSGRLRYARTLRGWSTRALGEAAGLSTGAVHKLEGSEDGGAGARVGNIEALAKVLHVAPAWIAFDVGTTPTKK